jgi:hypothetical protein
MRELAWGSAPLGLVPHSRKLKKKKAFGPLRQQFAFYARIYLILNFKKSGVLK